MYAPEWRENLARFNFEAGFPTPDLETAKAVLRKHIAVCKKNEARDHYVVRYNKEAWAKLSGETPAASSAAPSVEAASQGSLFSNDDVPTPSSPFDGMKDLDNSLKVNKPAASLGGSDFDLSELDEALG